MKKKTLVIALAALFLFAASGTAAYYTAEERAHNIVTTGGVDVVINEWADGEADAERVPYVDVLNVVPAMTVTKVVEVENKGAEAWIRVQAVVEISLAEGVDGQADSSLVAIDYNTEAWTLVDGWYYHNEAVAPGESTAPLFTEVTFSPLMGNMYQNAKVTVGVLAQAVQTANNGETVSDAAGWPVIGEE